jgi:hypothetical protein
MSRGGTEMQNQSRHRLTAVYSISRPGIRGKVVLLLASLGVANVASGASNITWKAGTTGDWAVGIGMARSRRVADVATPALRTLMEQQDA